MTGENLNSFMTREKDMKTAVLSLGLSVVLAFPAAMAPTAGYAQDPGSVARGACEDAVVSALRNQRGAGRVSFSGANLRQVSNAETGVSGNGSFGNTSFSYQCVYNIRNGRTSNVSVRTRGGGSAGGNDAGNVVGAIIGAAIAGAIINAIDDNGHGNTQSRDDGWWSPEGNISCNSYQSICQEQGRYSAEWTHRIYGG